MHASKRLSFVQGTYSKKVSLRIERKLAQRLAITGLSVKTFGIIMMLLEEEGQTQIELGKRADVPGYATTRGLDKLEQQGLIERRAHPTSRRANLIYLTEKGQELREILPPIIQEINDDFLGVCDAEERKVLQGALVKILESGHS